MIKLSDYVIRYLSSNGVSHIFMLPGGGCMHLVDSVGRNGNLEFVGCLHEQAAAIAADGYAQYKNDIGVALVTTGPGGTNAVTAVAASWIDSTPVLVISGQVKRSDLMHKKGVRQMGVQEVDITRIVQPITKYAVTVTEPESIRYHLEKAVFLARNGRPGPVWIDIPLDVQAALIEEDSLNGFCPDRTRASEKGYLTDLVRRAIELLNHSTKPVILAGRGIRIAGAEKAFKELIHVLRIPVLTTWRAADLIGDDDEYFFGRPGSIASRYANFVLQSADFLMTVGARLDLPQVGFNYKNFAPKAKKVIVDVDEAEIKKTGIDVEVPVVSDAAEFIKAFLENLRSVKPKDRSSWILKCKEWKEKYPVILPEYLDEKRETVNTYALIECLSEVLTEEDIIVPGSSGSCAEITLQALRVKEGQRVINSPGLGSMGFGLPQSIGVCLASGKRRTIAIVGDGGLQHNIQELETLRRLNLPIKLFVLNNNGYASIRNTQNRFFKGHLVCCDPSSGLTLPDTCKIADVYGIKNTRIFNHRNLKGKIKEVLDTKGPFVCEIMVDPDLQIAPRLSSALKQNGTVESRSLEDLWPFLDRDELARNLAEKK